MATLQEIQSNEWSLSLTTIGAVVEGLDDINQCIFIIMTTQKGSDPFRPEFGVDLLSYIDKPVNFVIPKLTQEILEQVQAWEPRVTITRIASRITGDSQIEIDLEWMVNSKSQITTAQYGI